jgi:hypothetical protein
MTSFSDHLVAILENINSLDFFCDINMKEKCGFYGFYLERRIFLHQLSHLKD